MSDVRVTFRLDSKLRRRLRRKAKSLGRPESEIVRAAVEKELNITARPRTFYDALIESGFIGCIPDAPRDLSTNKKYMEGFGEWDSDAYRRRPVGRAGRAVRAKSSTVR